MNEIHDYARRFMGKHGDKAEVEAAQKVAECESKAKGRKLKKQSSANILLCR